MLRHIYRNVELETDNADLQNDILTYACRVAGAASCEWGDSPETDLWKNISTEKEVFNEVCWAYEYGKEKDIANE